MYFWLKFWTCVVLTSFRHTNLKQILSQSFILFRCLVAEKSRFKCCHVGKMQSGSRHYSFSLSFVNPSVGSKTEYIKNTKLTAKAHKTHCSVSDFVQSKENSDDVTSRAFKFLKINSLATAQLIETKIPRFFMILKYLLKHIQTLQRNDAVKAVPILRFFHWLA